MPYPFTGQLNKNEIFNALYNVIISIQTEANNIAGTYSELVDAARVDGTLLGDTKLFIDTDVLETHAWGNDAEAENLLALDRPKNPETQAITLNVFRQIRVTVDQYLSKRAFYNEGAFAQFNAVLLGWMYDTKKVHDARIYNTFVGTEITEVGKQHQLLDLESVVGDATGEEKNRLRGSGIARFFADLIVDLKDATRDYNDYGYLRSMSEDAITIIVNSKYLNEIEKIDLPTIFHKEGLVGKLYQHVLPSRYFGIRVGAVSAQDNDGTYRSLVEKRFSDGAGKEYHVFPADFIPAGLAIEDGEAYKEDSTCIAKVTNKLPPFMSGFTAGTTFFNPRSLTENHYLTYGYNTLEKLKGKAWITVNEKVKQAKVATKR